MARSVMVYAGEDVQWHLTTSSHDRCPRCRARTMQWDGTRRRYCSACHAEVRLHCTPAQWQRMVEEAGGVLSKGE